MIVFLPGNTLKSPIYRKDKTKPAIIFAFKISFFLREITGIRVKTKLPLLRDTTKYYVIILTVFTKNDKPAGNCPGSALYFIYIVCV